MDGGVVEKSSMSVPHCTDILCLTRESHQALCHKSRDQLELFITGSLQQLVPDAHVLARVNGVLDLGWLREEVAVSHCDPFGCRSSSGRFPVVGHA